MRRSTLREALRDHYTSRDPRPDLVEELVSRTAGHSHQVTIARARVAAAASLALALVCVALWWGRPASTSGRLVRAIAAEISANHHKKLAPEFPSDEIAALTEAMDRLGFTVVAPDRLRGSGLRVLGARYCSLSGQAAAQIQLVDSSGRRHTLYETSPLSRLSGVDRSVEVDGIEVEVWHEKGLLFGWARPLDWRGPRLEGGAR